MRTKWARDGRRMTRRFNSGGRRVLAGLLAVAMVFGLMNINLPEAKAEEKVDYEAEKKARQEEYEKKFDLETLTWRDNSARPYLYWRNDVFGGIEGKIPN